MNWKCPACGFEENDESCMICICGNQYSPETPYHMPGNCTESVEINPITKRNIAAIKGTYPFFVAVVAVTAVASRSLRFIITCFVPTIIAGYYIYNCKPKKTGLSHDEAIQKNSLDIPTIVASDPKFYGNITKVELGIIAVFTLVIPGIVSYVTSYDTERFLGSAFVLGFGGSMFAVLAIIVKRSLPKKRQKP